MPTPSSGDSTQLLLAWKSGDQSALNKLIPLVENELHRVADSLLRRDRPRHELQATALVNEAYLRLIDAPQIEWQSRAHFFAIAARVMRRILLDYTRSNLRSKRGGAEHILLISPALPTEKAVELLALDEALKRLSKLDERKSKVMELRYFGGLTAKETASVLNLSEATVFREWKFARAWLLRAMEKPSELPKEEFEVTTVTEDTERTLAEAWSNRELVATLMSENWAGLKLLVQLRLSPNVGAGELTSILGTHTSIVASLLLKLAQFGALEERNNIFTLTNRGAAMLENLEKAIGKIFYE